MSGIPTPNIPSILRSRNQWLVWRLVQLPDEKKPRKVPFYVSGAPRKAEQATPKDIAQLGSFDDALAAVRDRGYTGIGFAPLPGSGIVALDFDNCVDNGQVTDSRIEALIDGTYAELSPSGTGLRAFFTGDIRSRKDNASKTKRIGGVAGAPRIDGEFDIEVFGTNGFVTVTGNATGDTTLWGLEDTVLPLTDAVKALYLKRFRDTGALQSSTALVPSGADPFGEGFADLSQLAPEKLGWSLEQAREYLFSCNANASRQEWLQALMAIHHEFDGSEEALDLVDEWSATGDSYAGRRDVEGRWRSFGRHTGGSQTTGKWLLAWRRDQVAAATDETMRESLAAIQQEVTGAADLLDLQTRLIPAVSKLLFDFPVLEIELYSLVAAKAKEFSATITKTEFKKLVKRERPMAPHEKVGDLTEFGNTDRMLRRFGESLMYVPDAEQWYVWTGNHWRRALGNRTEIEHFAKTVICELHLEKDQHINNQEEFFAFCSISQRSQMVASMVRLAESDQRVCVPAYELDKHKHLLGVKNGVVDLTTGLLIPASPSYRITFVTACEYTPGARCPLFEKVLRDAFYNDTEMIEYVVRSFGYAIQANPKESAMFIAFGNGANGKGTIIDSVRKMLGGYARVVDPATFLSDGKGPGAGGGGPREDLLRLRGARLLYVNEPDNGGVLKEGLVKAMTGGDTILARGIHAKASIEIEPTWTIYMPTNHKPVILGDDNGIWRRMRLLPFERDFRNDPNIPEDTGLKDRIAAAEFPGILAMIVRAGLRYRDTGLVSPKKISAASDAYRKDQDYLGMWIEDKCEVDPGFSCLSSELWESWRAFAEEGHFLQYIRSSIALGRKLESKFPSDRAPGGARKRIGIRIKPISDPFSG